MTKRADELDPVHCGDCLEWLPTLADNSVDSCVTDPPYELGFMGKHWDATGIAYNAELWRQVLRVLKPGAHLLSFGGSRTYHRMACAIEDAGFEIRDQIQWLYGSGFPKSLDVSKAIDKAAGAERHTVGVAGRSGANRLCMAGNFAGGEYMTTAPATAAAQQWDGWGTALKPAHEPICVARKPLSEKTVAANVLKWGTGAINVDGCRVSATENMTGVPSTGRFPANVIHDGSEDVLAGFPKSSTTGLRRIPDREQQQAATTPFTRGKNAPEYTDAGSASRFFYCAKASKSERGEGNGHPTVKPLALMRYLCRLVTPPGGTVIEPFAGSGTTCVAAIQEGFSFMACEASEPYAEIARARIASEWNETPLFAEIVK